MSRVLRAVLLSIALAYPAIAAAEGVQFNGTCSQFTWAQSAELDLAGYKIYDRSSQTVARTFKSTFGANVTTASCSTLQFNPGQHYASISAFDTSGNESPLTADIPFVIILDNQVSDLRLTAIGSTSFTVAFTEVNDGAGAPSNYDVRIKSPSMDWGTAASVASGTCSTPLIGTAIGATMSCTITGLSTTTPYEIQLVPYRGTIGVDAIYGPLSNVTGGTTGGTIDDLGDRTVIASFAFAQANGALGSPWEGGYTTGVATFDLAVVSNVVRSSSLTNDAIMTISTPLLNDQWCEIVLTTITGSGVRAPRCILAANGPGLLNGYEFTALVGVSGIKARIGKWVNGQFPALSVLASNNVTNWVSTDVLRGEKRGSTLTLYRNGTLILTATDSTYIGGRGGIIIYPGAAVANVEVDNIRFGGFSSGAGDACGCN